MVEKEVIIYYSPYIDIPQEYIDISKTSNFKFVPYSRKHLISQLAHNCGSKFIFISHSEDKEYDFKEYDKGITYMPKFFIKNFTPQIMIKILDVVQFQDTEHISKLTINLLNTK